MPASARRELIVAAALEEFAEHGYDAASMGRVGEAAGISRTVLYDHFPSKQAMFNAVVEDKGGALLDHLRREISGDRPIAERMRATIEAFVAFAEAEPAAWQLLHPAHAPADDEVRADLRRHRRESNRLIAGLLAPDVRAAGLDPGTRYAEAIFAAQQAALDGIVRWWLAHPDVDRDTVVEAAMTSLWSGVSGLEERG